MRGLYLSFWIRICCFRNHNIFVIGVTQWPQFPTILSVSLVNFVRTPKNKSPQLIIWIYLNLTQSSKVAEGWIFAQDITKCTWKFRRRSQLNKKKDLRKADGIVVSFTRGKSINEAKKHFNVLPNIYHYICIQNDLIEKCWNCKLPPRISNQLSACCLWWCTLIHIWRTIQLYVCT